MTIFENILLGAIASIIASIVCALVTQLYRFGAKRKIDYCIGNAILAFHSFENAIKYNYYDLAIAQVDIVLNELNNINQNICFFTYFPTKRKLFYTFMNNVSRFMTVAKNVERGHSDENEKQARCEKIKHYLDYASKQNNSWILINLDVMRNLNDTRLLRKALRKGFFDTTTDDEFIHLYEKLIEINSFDTKAYINKYELRANGYTKEQYLKKIKKIIKHGGKR